MDLTTNVLMQLVCIATKPFDLNGTPTSSVVFQFTDELADGTGADEADMLWFDAETMIADATDPLDLNGGFTDVYGDALTMARVKCIMFKNTSTTASILEVGPHANGTPFAGPWTTAGGATGAEAWAIPPGGGFMIFTPGATAWVAGAAATDVLEVFESSSLAAIYEIAVVGASA